MQMIRMHFLFFTLLSLTFNSCSNFSKISSIDIARTYSPEKGMLNPEVYVVHSHENYSHVNIEIPSKELFYVQRATDNYYTAKFKININVWDADNNNKLMLQIDSVYTDTLQNIPRRKIRQLIKIPLSLGKDYLLHLRFEDLQKRRTADQIIHSDKKSTFSRGFFSFAQENNQKSFQTAFVIPTQKKVTINHSTNNDFKVLVTKMIYPDEPANVPFVNQNTQNMFLKNLETDTTFIISFDKNSTASFELPHYGLYYFSDPDNSENGFLAMNFWEDYPELPADDNILKPLRYITTQEEYENLFTFDDPYLAMERFWTKITGNPDRAIIVRDRYNQRVVEANQYFSSLMPGWQTDRGIIYIVFGAPDKVISNPAGESWYYNEKLNDPGLHFEFEKYDNPFTEKHMVLQRKPIYRNSWNIALDRWRR